MGKGEGWGEGLGEGEGQNGNDWDHGLLGCCKSPIHCKLKFDICKGALMHVTLQNYEFYMINHIILIYFRFVWNFSSMLPDLQNCT